MSTTATLEPVAIEYPESDGEPMAETGIHLDAMILIRQAMEDFYAGRTDVFVSTDQFWFWNEGSADDRIAPDVFVALGVPDRPLAERGSFRSWEENGVTPSIVFEMASKGTWQYDLAGKKDKYEALGVREYFLFDPLGEHFAPRLRGFRLVGRRYEELAADENDGFDTELGFRLTAEGEMIRVAELATGRPVLTRREQVEAFRQQAEAEARKAKAEKKMATAEKQRADDLAAQVARLQALLAQHNIPTGNGP